MAEPSLPHIPSLTGWLSQMRIPTWVCLIILIFLIGLLLLLSGDFGLSWDVQVHEAAGFRFYEFYMGGLDADRFRANHPAIHYGALIDALIGIAQDSTTNPLQRLKIRSLPAGSAFALLPDSGLSNFGPRCFQ